MTVAAGTVHALPDEALGNTSYLIEIGRGLAGSVDPRRDLDGHLELAERLGLRIVAGLETHLHADFVSGSRELGGRTGADVYAARDAHLEYGHRGVGDGDQVAFGDVVVEAWGTPGHTPEHLSYVVLVDGSPTAVFSGGSLIRGGAARTDLVDRAETDRWSREQFRSIRRLNRLPASTALWPTHGAGSFCAAAPGQAPAGTIGDERAANPLLRIDDEDTFVRTLRAGFGSFPPYFLRLREVNRHPALLRDLDAPRPLDPATGHAAVSAGAWLVDARAIHDWARLHPEGAVSIELRPAFPSWLGWVIPFGAPIVLLVDDASRAEALRLARRIGYDRLVGWIDGGIDAWAAAGLPTRCTEEIDAPDALRRITNGATLVDVRQDAEVDGLRVPGAVHIELGDIIAGRTPDADETVTVCGHGERSATAASLLERRGIRAANLAGGIGAWESAGLPIRR
ncbi:MAG TPA: rhodanese-like domain-containing protein [Acidimicrobiia bacterium]|nr:rhodanese-like domain-containing protein [Acidimicrobiia bacterium]